jgi:RNA polymerase sigma-70 factor (ECF subfamily)
MTKRDKQVRNPIDQTCNVRQDQNDGGEYHAGVDPLPADDVLVERLRGRDEAAFAQVLDAWSAGLLRLARSFVSTSDSAHEVVQETWLAVITNLDGFEGRSALKTWVYRICVNTAKRRAQRESRSVPLSSVGSADDRGPTVDPALFRPAGDPFPGHWWEFPAPWPAPETALLTGETTRVLAGAVDELPRRQRMVLTLRDIEGYTSDEVCAILEVTAANQRVLLHRARAAVRAALAEYFEGADGGL